jgi:DNA-binding MarR family transcriptional regulator
VSRQKIDLQIKKIRILPGELDTHQPLARFMITLFNLFEDEIVLKMQNTPYEDISRTDMNTLRYIGYGGETSSQLAKFAGISKQAMGRQIESLSRRGYVKTAQDSSDARMSKISLTEKGSDLVIYLIKEIKKIELRFKRKIGESAYEKMKADLSLLIGLYENQNS